MKKKICTGCENLQKLDDFYDKKGTSDGKGYVCKFCQRTKATLYRLEQKKSQAFLKKTKGMARCQAPLCIQVEFKKGLCKDHYNSGVKFSKKFSFVVGQKLIYIDKDIAYIEIKKRRGKNLYAVLDTENVKRIKDFKWMYHDNGVSAVQNKKTIKLRRKIMEYSGVLQVIHLDHDMLNYRKQNLRIVTRQASCILSSLSTRNTSGIKGVSWDKKGGKWFAFLGKNGKRHNGGYHKKLDDAVRPRNQQQAMHWEGLI